MAATALAKRSCNLSLVDLDGVADRGGMFAPEVVVEEADEGLVGFCDADCFAESSSARILSSLASTPATAWDKKEPHLDDFWGVDISD